MAKKDAKKVRVEFYAPTVSLTGEPTASVWAAVLEWGASGKQPARLQLLHDYPDLKPSAGWIVRYEGELYEVREAKLPLLLIALPAVHSADLGGEA